MEIAAIDSRKAVEIFREAANGNREDPLLRGSLLEFPNYGQLIMTGDLHGHRRNFQKLQRYCDLQGFSPRHIILHEIIHEEVVSFTDFDNSHEVLLEAAQWKCEFPDQVHFLLSNHELAQITGQEISKNGRIVTSAFEDAVRAKYGDGGNEVNDAIRDFLRTYPLAGRTDNRVFLSHSLPAPREVAGFDETILTRPMIPEDYDATGSAHALVWGRHQTEATLQTMCEVLDVDYFICGHQPQETGYEIMHDRQIILASEHNHGTFMTIDLAKPVTIESLTNNIRPIAGLT
jgi:Calcineurin-like phosphoesterase